jgi:beta-glucosidase
LIGVAAAALALSAARADEPKRPVDPDALIGAMTLQEKVGQLQSAAPAIPRLGIPAYAWWSEGLHGIARNGYATVFPQAIGLAAAWDPDLMRRVGDVVSTEARAKYDALGPHADHGRYQGLTIWSPNINIFRDPRWGRGQETYGEDPYLTGRLAVAFIQGVQGPDPAHPKAIATVKHFAVHSGPEPGRHGFDVDVAPWDLEATYLPAFRAAVTEGRVGSVMCAYNALHGTPACANADLMQRLRGDWKFDGFVVSDCDAVDDMTQFHHFRADNAGSSAAALATGDDLDCGFAYRELAKAVQRGDVGEEALDRALRRLLRARAALGNLEGAASPWSNIGPDQVGTAQDRALALKAARESMVLLENKAGRLPLARGTRIAVVGPDADTLETLEANYHGVAVDPVTPLMGLRAALGADRVAYAQGAPVAEGVPAPVPETALRPSAGAGVGLTGAYYDNPDFRGAPRLVRTDRTIDFDWDEVAPAPELEHKPWSVRWTGMLQQPGPGDYVLAARVERCFDCKGHDPVRLWVDDRLVLDDPGDGAHAQAKLHFDDARPHRIRFELVHAGQDQGVRLQWSAPAEAQLAEAAAAARQADVVVAFVGLSPDVEGEDLRVSAPGFDGGDRTDIGLPAPQLRLLDSLAATGKPVVIVLMSGSAVALDWGKDHADAVLAAWYPGQAGGRAIADTLLGANDPGGRLPVTFYRSTKDLPAFVDYGMRGRTYRYFAGRPLYPFGYGLSYASFAYSDIAAPRKPMAAGETLTVSAELRNTSAREGEEVAQAYLVPPQGPLAPLRSLVGFQRVRLKPGESRRVSFEIGPRLLSSVDAAGARAVEPGTYEIFIGGGQPGDAQGVRASFTIEGRAPVPR